MIEAFLYLSGVVSFTMILGGEPHLRWWFWIPAVVCWPVTMPLLGANAIATRK